MIKNLLFSIAILAQAVHYDARQYLMVTQANKRITDSYAKRKKDKTQINRYKKIIYYCDKTDYIFHHALSSYDMANLALSKFGTIIMPDRALRNYSSQNRAYLTPPSQEFLQKAQDILKKLNMDPDKIRILNGDIPSEGAALGLSTIILDEYNLSKLSEEEQTFIIGHEAIHLKQYHVVQDIIAALALPFISHHILETYNVYALKWIDKMVKKHKVLKNKDHVEIYKTAKRVHQFLVTNNVTKATLSMVLFVMFSRVLEREADIKAAKLLECAAGGATFFKRIQQSIRYHVNNNPLDWYPDYTQDGNNSSDYTHPPITSRIKYLSKLAAKQVSF